MREETKKNLKSYLDSLYPILYVRHSDFADVDKVLLEVAAPNVHFCEFNNALGAVNFSDKHSMSYQELNIDCFEGILKDLLAQDFHGTKQPYFPVSLNFCILLSMHL